MLTLKRMADGSKAELLSRLHISNPETFVYEAVEHGTQTGFAVFENRDGQVMLTHAVYGDDSELLDGLVRAGMAWLDDNGIRKLSFGEALDREILKKLHFITDDKNDVDSIGDFLKTCKKCRM